MSDNPRDQLINWLNDAVGMEENLVQTLSNHVKGAKDYPRIQSQIQQHLDITKQHADMVRQCIKDLGGNPSSMKQTVGKIQGMMQGMSTESAGDELIKDLLADFAAENFEIACYTSLIDACNAIGETRIAGVCDQIRSQEEDMAQRIMDAIPQVTTDYVRQQGQQRAA